MILVVLALVFGLGFLAFSLMAIVDGPGPALAWPLTRDSFGVDQFITYDCQVFNSPVHL
jgi:hypothetical protein